MDNLDQNISMLKAIGNPVRVKIVDMLSSGELNACKIIEAFDLSQSTISHHMKVLCDSGIVNSHIKSKWTYYHLNKDAIQQINLFLSGVSSCNKQ